MIRILSHSEEYGPVRHLQKGLLKFNAADDYVGGIEETYAPLSAFPFYPATSEQNLFFRK
jgi:hypothetical protein